MEEIFTASCARGGSPPLATEATAQTRRDLIRYAPTSIPHLRSPEGGNRAVDVAECPPEQNNLTRFDVYRANTAPASPSVIERFCRAKIPELKPSVIGNQAHDCQAVGFAGHSNFVTFANTGIPSSSGQIVCKAPEYEDGEFLWDGATLYAAIEGKRIRLANFWCEVTQKYIVAGIRAETQYLRIRYTKTGGNSVELDLPLDRFIEANYSELIRQHPEFCLFPDSGRQIQLYKLYSSQQYEKSGDIAWEYYYGCPGWHKTAGRARYYSAADAHCNTERLLAPLDDVDLLKLSSQMAGMLEIARPQVMLPTMLVMHAGPAKALFEEAGYREDFAMLLIAPSGSGKSYLARSFFTYQDGAFVNFEATDRAIELEMESRVDSACIIDDMKAGRNKAMTAKVEHVLRQIGDTTGRKKSKNGGKDQEQVVTRCSIIITAENDLDELQPSGRFRTLAVTIQPGELTHSTLLKKFHDDIVLAHGKGSPALLDFYMTAYIRYLEARYEEMVDLLANLEFSPPAGLQARQATIFVILAKQAAIVLRFWQHCGLVKEQEAADILKNQWLPILEDVLISNDRRGKLLDPVVLFVRAVAEGIASQRLAIAEDKATLESSSSRFTGFWDHDILKIFPDAVFDYVIKYYDGIGIRFVETQNGMLDKLYAAKGLLDVYEQKGHKAKLLKSVKLRGVKTSILCLIWPRVEQILMEAD